MLTKHSFFAKNPIEKFAIELSKFLAFFSSYIKKNVVTASISFEKYKNFLVKFFIMKRGRYNRPFLHFSAIGAIGVGIIISPIIAGTFPVFSKSPENILDLSSSSVKQSIIVGDDVFRTDISQKPRDKTVIYTVQKGDTISTIARKYGISEDTVKWENDLTGDSITVGDELKILPVTGVAYKVSRGETVYTIAKKLDTVPQKIVDFPFNEFANPETFSLVEGQELLVPDGIKPSERPSYTRPRPVFIASGPTSVSSAGFTWPLRGSISQFAAWYHMAIDIESDVGAPIVAANNGTVSNVITGTWDGGYGNNAYVDMGNGYVSHYAHMSSVYVSPGQSIVAGKTVIGTVGLTGRTTGPHLHFEISKNGVLQNPLAFLQ
ncbi:MAG: hypothetical protein A2186_03635 [Candidatus Levybacteria bacterium RIFOXYA1_FULL_41_10]|nr:MAG: peptidase M23 [Candidatus Levybacteria bacterium GW2011_GWC1_40_19]KKR73654.1 MAG: Peptidase M23 family protein [Candidatus Levybacteria bacterium GW2011_GWC2_40_7]KKR94427.1 MAG: Peptidase M23 family protein [Candidatus Levybacteria bacterium GW2011_GWA2_41_15]OGH24670.1 MAG: hypothetical protein A3D82_04140 [Candidatus Levybacteria bacterium RIFCSPHIGHO2_02_FULL_40_29]OGH32118.1 MAG: hypothetical protein A3E70_01190 [Candidatus Levybacteria bacterium RIFCSPHIGHO2_12_FULL_40_44]OGH509